MRAAIPPPGTPVLLPNGTMDPNWYVAFVALLNRTGGTSDDLVQRSLRVTNTGLVVATDPANGGAITRTIVGVDPVVVTDGSGVAGNPTISLNGSLGNDGFGFNVFGLLSSGEFLGSGVWGFDMDFPSADFPDEISVEFAPTADAVFNLLVGATSLGGVVTGGSIVGTITFLAGHTTGTASWMSGAGYTLSAATTLMLKAPSPNDATLYGVTAVLYGDKQ